MGIHFVNLTVQGPPDPMKPNVLIYEPHGGKLRLVAAEWLVPLAAVKERPSLLASPFRDPWKVRNRSYPKGSTTMICMLGCSKTILWGCSVPPIPM
jgi:hypothetical protein